ncbi:MAG: HAMP domain-containing histidine kinase [Betaproteobacteria bacterium]|nr:HAMP domain-containing histidine kinase [Betaproteobacteria bacterium]
MRFNRLDDLSLRYKIPLRVIALVLVTAFCVTASMVFREYDESRRDLVAHAAGLGRVLADTLTAPMVHDDLWRAYEVVRTPQLHNNSDFETLSVASVVVLDTGFRTFVSTQPIRYPLGLNPAHKETDFAYMQHALATGEATAQRLIEPPASDHLYVVTPIIAEGVLLGHLALGYSRQVFAPRLRNLIARSALVTLLVLTVLLPLSTWWARRLADPLVALAAAMDQVAERLPDPTAVPIPSTGDEIGHLAQAFRGMLVGLHEKAQLEQHMLVAERLAAVGRLSAGIAHEINNPLGGMLNALNTLRRHGAPDALTEKTLSLLERGLTQVRNTVAALLVEAKVENHPLTSQDIEDIHILVMAAAQKKTADFVWRNRLDAPLPLPSTLVRQVLLNLLLNAVQAIDASGRVECDTHVENQRLVILVENDGKHIPADHLPYLFEPFATERSEGSGLGLWVTYQIVQQLQGSVEVDSQPGLTRFVIELPLPESA